MPGKATVTKMVWGGKEISSAKAYARAEASLRDKTGNTPFIVVNDTFEEDPKFGVIKDVELTIKGENDHITVLRGREYDSMFLGVGPHTGTKGPGEDSIIDVVYGDKQIDNSEVMGRLRASLEHKNVGFTINNESLGGDPQKGVVKKCAVTVVYADGRKITKVGFENFRNVLYLADGVM